MAGKWYRLADSDDAFLMSAPFRYVHSVETPAPPEKIWDVLAAGDPLVSWTLVFTKLRWVTPRPFGVGTVREITLLKVFTVRERFSRWEDGQRYSYSVFEASLPGLRRAAEDYVIEPTSSGSRLTWTLAVEPLRPMTLLFLIGGPVISGIQRHVLRTIRSHVGN